MKRDSGLSACGGVMLQRFEFTKVCMEENVKRHFSRNFDIFFNKNDLPQCLVVFSIVLSLFSATRSLLIRVSSPKKE